MKNLFFPACLCLFLSAGCGFDDDAPVGPVFNFRPAMEVIADNEDFDMLQLALNRTGLDSILARSAVFTIFAPTDQAFADADIDVAAVDSTTLDGILRYHVIPNSGYTRASLGVGQLYIGSANLNSPNGSQVQLYLDRTETGIRINNTADVVDEELLGTNAVIQPINAVLLPPTVADLIRYNSGLTEFASLLETAPPYANGTSIPDTLRSDGPFTMFAPNDASVADDLMLTDEAKRAIVAYHVVPGRNTRANSFPGLMTTLQEDNLIFSGNRVQTTSDQAFNIIFTNIQGTNGILHLVDELMRPEGF